MAAENETPSDADVEADASGDGTQPDSPKTTLRLDWLRKRARSTRQWLHYRLPNLALLQDPSTRQYAENRDRLQNIETRVPPEEGLRVRSLWGVEVYGPTEVEGLYASLKRLEWDRGGFPGQRIGALKWIAEQRMYGSEGIFNLGFIRRRSQYRLIFGERHAPIPETVDFMHGYIYQVSPSTTAVILCFILNEDASSSYEATLNTDCHTTTQRNRRSGINSIFDVEHSKRRSVESVRSISRKMVTNWFKENLPGFFSLADDGNRLPTAELITTANQPLLSETKASARNEPPWVLLIKNYGFRNVWTSKEFPGLSVAWDESEDANRFHSIVSLQTGLLRDDHLKYKKDRGTGLYFAFVSERIEGILVNFAVVAFLRDVLRALRLTRDTMSSKAITRRQVLTTISQIKLFFDKSIGLPTMTAELAAKSKNDRSYRWYWGSLKASPGFPVSSRKASRRPFENEPTTSQLVRSLRRRKPGSISNRSRRY